MDDRSIESNESALGVSAGASGVSASSKDVAETTILEIHRLLERHRKAVKPPFIKRIFPTRNRKFRANVQEYLKKLQILQKTVGEQRTLHGIDSSIREIAGENLITLYDEMKRRCRKVEEELRYGKRGTSVKMYTVKLEQLNAKMTNIFDVD